eukprot:6128392-Pleurochrysis_carterae.AAC.1
MGSKFFAEDWGEKREQLAASHELRRLGRGCAEDALVKDDSSDAIGGRQACQCFVSGHVKYSFLPFMAKPDFEPRDTGDSKTNWQFC